MFTKSNLFKSAHALARHIIKAGDSYSATFSIALKEIYALLALRSSCEKVKRGQANNNAEYIEVSADDVDNFYGRDIIFSVNALKGGLFDNHLLPEFMRDENELGIYGVIVNKFVSTGKGKAFANDAGQKRVRIYGNIVSTQIQIATI